jgi:hypothetical protein
LSSDTRACLRTGNGLRLRQLSGDQDDKSPVTGDGYAGICGSPGLKCPGPPDRPGRSALHAVETCRKRCWKTDWVIDLDIQKFFDSVRWDLVVKAVEAHTDLPWVVLYVRRWLEAPLQLPGGTSPKRDRGTPQGSAISPVLANLFLHVCHERRRGVGCR